MSRFSIGCIVVIASVGIIAIDSGHAMGAWPADTARSIDGSACTPFVTGGDYTVAYCPFMSDYASSDSFAAIYNSTTYIDYHVSSTGSSESTLVQACRQSWAGSAAVCSTVTSTSGTGYHDLGVYAFNTISFSDQWDYYYVMVQTTETVDQIYGVDYY